MWPFVIPPCYSFWWYQQFALRGSDVSVRDLPLVVAGVVLHAVPLPLSPSLVTSSLPRRGYLHSHSGAVMLPRPADHLSLSRCAA